MYHIKEDKRSKTSAALVVDGLSKCLQDHEMSELTVSYISEMSGINRTTFYRLFDTPVDVLVYACDMLAERIIKDYMAVDLENKDEFVLFSLRYWREHYEILEAMFHCGRLDLVQQALEKHSERLIPEIEAHFNQNEADYLRLAAAGALSGLLKAWMRHGKKESPEELFAIYKKISLLIA